ncbi:PREDICTED: cation channel sperm-associated protein subunit delta [Nipponia nippon]|uniref:cation channel sperm-associated protein subunit delta n=1 Tax=Nipponia nippon TaxID=128390 RepID=UPI000511AD52|nr:PREDICTED: cation channel sperm-associated protein subunit delta [Nipponia nippon]
MAPQPWRALVASLCLWLCLCGHGGGLGCSHAQLAYSVRFGHNANPTRSIHVSYGGSSPMVLQHYCKGHGPDKGEPKAAMYLGKDVFISLDAFESSLSPLSIPDELEAKEAIVSAITFVHKDRISVVVNSQAYMYVKSLNSRRSVSNSHIFLSQDGGYMFTCFETSTREQGVLLRVYNFISFAMTSLLIDRRGEDGAGKAAGTYFRYNGTKTSHVSNHISTTFHLLPKGPDKLWSIQNLALRGFITLWTTDTSFLSANNGLIMEELAVWGSQQSCSVEILTGDFWNKIYYIDMHESLTLKAIFVPNPGKRSVSNPHVLAFSACVIEVQFTYGRNTKYLLHIVQDQQYFSEFAGADFCDGVRDGEMSAVTVDIPDNPIGCTDVAPLTAHVAVACPPTKHIRIVKHVTACDKSLIQEAALRNNFSYTISHNIYNSDFLARKHIQQDDLQINYNFTNLGCPLPVYYKNPWNRFQEHVPAEFVLFDINGMHNHDHVLTAHDAHCISQPQNWTFLLEEQESPDPNTAWTRRNYMSCKDRNGLELKWPSIKYQVPDGDKNKIIFPPYNGLYIFNAIVLDTFYSCYDLSQYMSVVLFPGTTYIFGHH